MVTEKKIDELKNKMKELDIDEKDIDEKFIVGSGKGGQKLHKSSTTVYLKHLPTGIEVKCQKSRSRELNRFLARRELLLKIEEKSLGKKSQKEIQREKIKKQKAKRKKRTKNKEKNGFLSEKEEPGNDSL